MSEYQYYEFRAIDHPLSQQQMNELRAISSRAEITATSFTNTYNFGDFRGNPVTLMENYFDAFIYLANWGTRELMLRVPRALLDPTTTSRYCTGRCATSRSTSDHVILRFHSDEESGGWVGEDEGESCLSSIITIRSELMAGDLRSLYLAWLLCAQHGEVDRGGREPPIPPGLDDLSDSLHAFRDFLRIDRALVCVAAAGSIDPALVSPNPTQIETWIRELPTSRKDEVLSSLIKGGSIHLRAGLLQELRRSFARAGDTLEPPTERRTVADLLGAAEVRREEGRQQEAERQRKEREHREAERVAARAKVLDDLSRHQAESWQEVESKITTGKPVEYDEAVRLLGDLEELCVRDGRTDEFALKFDVLFKKHAKKSSLISRLRKAGLIDN